MIGSYIESSNMLKDAFKKLVGTSVEYDSYDLLLLQATSYRLFKHHLSSLLRKHKFTTLEWSLLGILARKSSGARFIDLSNQMGVEPPFVTELIAVLKKRGYIRVEEDVEDRRAKCVSLSKKSLESILQIEKEIKEDVSTIFMDISRSDFEGYKKTIGKMLAHLGKRPRSTH